MKKNILNISMLVAAFMTLAVACVPESADLHPNHREVPEVPDVDPEEITDELGTLAIQLADYQQLGLKVKSIDIAGNNGEEINGTAVAGATGVSVSSGAAGNITITYNEPVDITWKSAVTPWTGDPVGAKAFAVQMTAAMYEKGLTFKITDDKDRVFKYVHEGSVLVETEEVDTLACLPVTVYYGTTNCVVAAPKAGNVEIDVTPHVSYSTFFVPEGGEVLDAEGKAFVDAKAASIVWQAGEIGVAGDVVGTPTLSGNVLKVPTTGKKGNAVVAIKDASGSVIWSYHVWVGEYNEVSVSFPDKYGEYTMLDRNLGATAIEPKDPDSYGVFYQWGRKDAFPRPQDIERAAARATTIAYTMCPQELSTETIGTIAYSIRHPETRIMTTSSLKDWHFFPRVQALWGNIKANSDPIKTSVKTVYDPCPAGYQIPEKEAFSGFNVTNKEMFLENYGFYDPTGVGDAKVFFPAGGIVQHTSTNLQYYEYEGFLWSNNPGSGGVYIMRFGDNGSAYKSNVSTMDRAYGCAVRCIKTEK